MNGGIAIHFISYPSLTLAYSHSQAVAINTDTEIHDNPDLQQTSPFPPVSIERLNTSAHNFQKLMRQADLLISKIVTSNEFAFELMEAAQLSNQKKVEKLILSTGISLKLETNYTPTGILIDLDNSEDGGGCCNLLMSLKW